LDFSSHPVVILGSLQSFSSHGSKSICAAIQKYLTLDNLKRMEMYFFMVLDVWEVQDLVVAGPVSIEGCSLLPR
jgi:hypothetical protein